MSYLRDVMRATFRTAAALGLRFPGSDERARELALRGGRDAFRVDTSVGQELTRLRKIDFLRLGDMLVCNGPPDSIVKGSSSVMIIGMPAARMGDSTAHGGTIDVVSEGAGLGSEFRVRLPVITVAPAALASRNWR